MTGAIAVALTLSTAAESDLAAQDEAKEKEPFVVPRASSEVIIDGVIEEQARQDALILELNYEVRPGENTEPPVRTLVFITYDE